MPNVNKKPLARKGNFVQTKNYAEKELGMDCENHLEYSRQIARIAAKEQTCVPYNRDRKR